MDLNEPEETWRHDIIDPVGSTNSPRRGEPDKENSLKLLDLCIFKTTLIILLRITKKEKVDWTSADRRNLSSWHHWSSWFY